MAIRSTDSELGSIARRLATLDMDAALTGTGFGPASDAEKRSKRGAFETRRAVFGAGRGAAAGRDVDIPRATERAERTKIDGL